MRGWPRRRPRRALLLRFAAVTTAPRSTPIYTLSLHDALPIWSDSAETALQFLRAMARRPRTSPGYAKDSAHLMTFLPIQDRKSTRLNSSHGYISYAVFCLKKKTGRDEQQRLERHRRTTRGDRG